MRCMLGKAQVTSSSQDGSQRVVKHAKNVVYSNLTLADISTEAQLNDYCAERLKNFSPCPVGCGEQHHFEKTFPFGKRLIPTRRLSACPEFEERMPDERGDLVKSLRACHFCLDTSHQGSQCRWKDQYKCAECGEQHHSLLHGSGVEWED